MTKQQETIDATPSWTVVASMIRLFLKDDTPPGIRNELNRMAALADDWVHINTVWHGGHPYHSRQLTLRSQK